MGFEEIYPDRFQYATILVYINNSERPSRLWHSGDAGDGTPNRRHRTAADVYACACIAERNGRCRADRDGDAGVANRVSNAPAGDLDAATSDEYAGTAYSDDACATIGAGGA